MSKEKTYCINLNCPFIDCKKHLKNCKQKSGEVKVAEFDGVCKEYISYVLDRLKEDEQDLENQENAQTPKFVRVVYCKDCKHQRKHWHSDRRMKEGGYWLYRCDRNDDPFVSHTVDGYDDEFCSEGERKGEENE